MNAAPIALFVHNRPWHARQTITALQMNERAGESDLFIFSDAPTSPETANVVREVREYIGNVKGFKSISIAERNTNLGLAKSIIDGVTRLCDEYGRVIVLEDDLVTSPYFLTYMNDALDLYEHEKSVMAIHGYMFPLKVPLPETFFLMGAYSWGWATWSRAWQLFEANGRTLLEELRNRKITHQFDLNGAYPFTHMLEDQIAGRNDSWAIRWRASVFLENGLSLFPGRSLVSNIGHDASGVHCSESDEYTVDLATAPINVVRIPQVECVEALAALVLYFRTQQRGAIARIFRRLRQFIKASWPRRDAA
jgi:hypothetical protein